MFGRQLLLAIDMLFNLKTGVTDSVPSIKYVQDLKKRLQWAYKRALQVNEKETPKMQKAL